MAGPNPERRKKSRIRRQYNAQINVEGTSDWHTITLQDLSAGGMSFLYDKSLDLGTTMRARINFPPAEGPIEIRGQVIRSVPNGSIYTTAIGFYDIADKHSDLINHFAAIWFPS